LPFELEAKSLSLKLVAAERLGTKIWKVFVVVDVVEDEDEEAIEDSVLSI